MVYVGRENLIGEVISLSSDRAIIQVYEETTGLSISEEVVSTGSPMCVTLGPGILSNIFDGIERPLSDISKFPEAIFRADVTYRLLTPKSSGTSRLP